MFYLPEEYSNYKYLVSASDNYVCLSTSHRVQGSWDDPDTISVIYQYFTPSIITIPSNLTFSSTQTFTNVQDEFSSSIFDRADFPQIFICNFLILFLFAFILNQLTKLVKKGGVFGSN